MDTGNELIDQIWSKIENTQEKDKAIINQEQKNKAIHYTQMSFDYPNSTVKRLSKKNCTLLVHQISRNELMTLCYEPKSSANHQYEKFDVYDFKSFPVILKTRKNSKNIKDYRPELRKRIKNTSLFPYSVHGLVRAYQDGRHKCSGSGILIGPNLVLTAAHIIYDYKITKKKYDKLVFIPGANDYQTPFGVFNVIESYIPDEFKDPLKKDDYGLLVLDGTPGVEAGYFGLHIAEKSSLKNNEMNVYGYPGSIRSTNGTNGKMKLNTPQLWGMKGKNWRFSVDEDNQTFISQNKVLSSPGQSGSGIFYYSEETKGYYVIGVHNHRKGGASNATWISMERFNKIIEWVNLSRRSYTFKELALPNNKTREKKIKNLNLDDAHVGDSDIELLAKIPLSKFKRVNLKNNNITALGAMILSEKTKWNNLTWLDLSDNKIGADGIVALSKNSLWVNLERLYLLKNDINAEGAAALSKNSSWINLEHLDLSNNNIGDQGAAFLSQNSSWEKLRVLEISNNNIGAEGAAALSRNTSWMHLFSLDLSENSIGDKGAATLSTNLSWMKLVRLYLSKNDIGIEGASALSKNGLWTKLKHLDLSENNIDDNGATSIIENSLWKHLEHLDLSENKISVESAVALRKKRWWIKI